MFVQCDAIWVKARQNGLVRDAAVLVASGIDEAGKRCLLGVSVSAGESEVHWRGFFESLVARGLRGVQMITSDDHAGMGAARRAVFGGVLWQRCQFHLQQNAQVKTIASGDCSALRAKRGNEEGSRVTNPFYFHCLRFGNSTGIAENVGQGIRENCAEIVHLA